MRRLLEQGVDPDAADLQGKRAVDLAAEAGRWAIVSALDPGYALPSAVAENEDDQVPPDRAPLGLLRDGLQADQRQGLEALAKLCSPQERGSLLHEPGVFATVARVEWLLLHGAAVEARDAHGDTPLFAQLERGTQAMPVAHALLQRGLSPAGAGGLARFLDARLQGNPSIPVSYTHLDVY